MSFIDVLSVILLLKFVIMASRKIVSVVIYRVQTETSNSANSQCIRRRLLGLYTGDDGYSFDCSLQTDRQTQKRTVSRFNSWPNLGACKHGSSASAEAPPNE